MYNFKFADIGEGIHEGVVLKWNFKTGEKVSEGDSIVLIETDKVNAEIPSPVSGIIKEIGPAVGEIIRVGELIAKIDDGTLVDESLSVNIKKEIVNEGDEEKGAAVVGEIEISDEVIKSSIEHAQIDNSRNKRILATPVARKLAKDLNVDIMQVVGSGENGRVLKEDIRNYEVIIRNKPNLNSNVSLDLQKVTLPKFDEQRIKRVKISKLRQTIAKNMILSKSVIPHTTIMDEINVSKLVELRQNQLELIQKQGTKLTFMPFIIKALALSIKEYPIFNSSFDNINNEIIYKNYVNIGIAVDTKDGLIVPNIKNPDKLGIIDIAKELNRIKEAASNKLITLNDLKEGTFSLTNYGIFDSTFGVPVIKYPEVAIMGIGRITKKPVVINNEIVIAEILPLSLSIDHRVIDGGDAGRFLKLFKKYLTNPMLLLLS